MTSVLLLYFQLSYEFLKTGLFSFGGGLATLPFLSSISERTGWYTQQQLADMIAISESTPGPIGVNMATFAGYQVLGVPGAVVATVSLVLPSLCIVILLAKLMAKFSENKYVQAAMYGLRPAVAAMIAVALYGLARISLFSAGFAVNWKAMLIFAAVFLALNIKKLQRLHPAVWLFLAAAAGVALQII